MKTGETWRPVAGLEGVCEVSSWGRVRHGSTIIKPFLYNKYNHVYAGPEGAVTIHRVATMVCAAWRGPKPPGCIIRHLDGDFKNDIPWNLAYWSNRDEAPMRRSMVRAASLSVEEVLEIRRSTDTPKDLAEIYEVSLVQIHNILSRRSWPHLSDQQRSI